MCYDALAVGASSLGVHNALRDTLSGEVGKLVEKMEVLDQDGSVGAYCQ